MHILKFYGYSDDTFGEYRETGQDVDNCGSLGPVQCVIDCGEQGRLMVIGQYTKASLDWKIVAGYCAEVEYSPELVIEIPDGPFELEWYKNGVRVDG